MKTLSKKDAQKWANALRSGKYKQTTASLQDKDGYCCLGVACDIFIPKGKLKKHGQYLYGGLARDQKYAPSWLKNVNLHMGSISTGMIDFVLMNDIHEYSFDMIADVIELVYVHKALD